MITHERRPARTVPFPAIPLPWPLTGWGVAALGVGFALGMLAVAAVAAWAVGA